MVKRFSIFGLYFLYVLVLIFIFAHVLFPEKKGAYLASSIIQKNLKLNFYCDRIELKLPFKFIFIKPEISGKNVKDLKFSKIEVRPNFLSFFKGKLSFHVGAYGYSGAFVGDCAFGLFNPLKKINGNFSVNQVDIKALGESFDSDIKFEGLVSAKFKFGLDNEKGSFNGYADLNNFNVLSRFIIVPVSVIGINRCELNGSFNKNIIKIDNSNLKAKAGLASFSGSVTLLMPFERSSLNLSGKFVPDIAYLGKNKNDPALSMLFSVLKTQKNIEYSLTGKVLNPSVRLK